MRSCRHASILRWRRAHGGVGCYSAPPEYNVIGPRARHVDRIGEFVDADSHGGQELVAQNFAGMDRWKPAPGRDIRKVHNAPVNVLTLDGHWNLLVVANDLDIPSLVVTPNKTDAPLVVDANTELTFPGAMQSFQPITGWCS